MRNALNTWLMKYLIDIFPEIEYFHFLILVC